MQVSTPVAQHAVMIEAVENHMPQVIVIDEIGTELEAAAARTIAERGVQLIGTAHGSTLENLLVNPTLNDLLGGIHTVTLSDEEARRRDTQKSVLERKSPPTFDVLVELQERDRVVVHMPVDDVVDEALRGRVKPPQVRMRGDAGQIISRIETAPREHAGVFEPAPFAPGERRRRDRDRDRDRRTRGFDVDQYLSNQQRERRETWGEPPSQPRAGQSLAIFPYGVSRQYLEQSVRELKLPVRIQHHVEDSDMVMTLKNYYRRKDSPVRTAESSGIPIEVLRSNTVTQIKGALARMYGVSAPDTTEVALQEAMEGITRAQQSGGEVELAPQNAYVRRLQHKLVERHELGARSRGDDPNRRLVILRLQDEQ